MAPSSRAKSRISRFSPSSTRPSFSTASAPTPVSGASSLGSQTSASTRGRADVPVVPGCRSQHRFENSSKNRPNTRSEVLPEAERRVFIHVYDLGELQLNGFDIFKGPPIVAGNVASLEAAVQDTRVVGDF